MWEKTKKVSIGTAVAMIIIVHCPPVLTDPVVTAVSQMRMNSASSFSTEDGTGSVMESVSKSVKKALR